MSGTLFQTLERLLGPDETRRRFLAAYRAAHPESRASHYYTLHGSSGTVRRYTCVACRCVIDSESAKYAPTKHAERRVEAHLQSCKTLEQYLTMETT